MLNRVTDIIPKDVASHLTSLGATDWLTVHLSANNGYRVEVHNAPKEIIDCAPTPGDKLVMLALSKWLANGPKVFRPNDLQCQALSEVEVRVPPSEYRQSFETLLVELPAEFTERYPQRPIGVLTHHIGTNLVIAHITENCRCDIVSFVILTAVDELEDVISSYRENIAPEDCDLTRTSFRIALNANLLLTNYGRTIRPLNRVEWDSNRRLAAKGNVEAQRRCKTDLRLVELEQSVTIYDTAQSQQVGGTHASPRPHWRRGHWRQQAFGKGHAQRRLLFIKPILVNGDGLVISTTYTKR